jgi:hypothetical protein
MNGNQWGGNQWGSPDHPSILDQFRPAIQQAWEEGRFPLTEPAILIGPQGMAISDLDTVAHELDVLAPGSIAAAVLRTMHYSGVYEARAIPVGIVDNAGSAPSVVLINQPKGTPGGS